MTDSDYRAALDKLNTDLAAHGKALTTAQSQAGSDSSLWWSTNNAMTMSVAVLVFGLTVCALGAWLIHTGKAADDVLKALGTILIIVAAVFLIVAGYDDKQIAPVIGLLGTIAGYMLGKSTEGPKA